MTVRVAGDPPGAIKGDPDEAFRLLARDQLPRLVSIARRLVGDDAEDMVQPRRATAAIDLPRGPHVHTTSTPPAADAGQGGVDPDALREEIRVKYAEGATHADGAFHCHTGAVATGRPSDPRSDGGWTPRLLDGLPQEMRLRHG